MQLITVWFGSFLYDGGRIAGTVLFPRDPTAIAARLMTVSEGAILDEERTLADGQQTLLIGEERLKDLPGSTYGPDNEIQAQRAALLAQAGEHGFDASLLHDAALAFARQKTTAAIGSKDRHLAQAVSAVDDVTKSLNILTERLTEWYGFHFPEFTKTAHGDELARMVSRYGDRDTIGANVEKLAQHAESSIGAELAEGDKAVLMLYATQLANLYKTKEKLEKHIEARMHELAPNVAYLVGSTLGAKLIKYTGSLERLARVPASTIQLLGAEKALFRHLKEHAEPPKYGVIFQHPFINQSKWWHRGKIARTFAAKIAIAAKADYHGGDFIADDLEKQVRQRIDAVRRAYPEPPAGKQKKKRYDADRKPQERGRNAGRRPQKRAYTQNTQKKQRSRR